MSPPHQNRHPFAYSGQTPFQMYQLHALAMLQGSEG